MIAKNVASSPKIRYLTPCSGRLALNSKYDFGNRVAEPKISISPASIWVIILTMAVQNPSSGQPAQSGLVLQCSFATLTISAWYSLYSPASSSRFS